MSSLAKRLLVGRPTTTAEEASTRLPKRVGLAVFSSDALSSTAYATEEMLVILVPVAGLAAIDLLVPLSLVVAAVLAVVVASYRQTIHAYPNGGGAYVVARENLGERASLVAGASLLIDYTLTVAVSVSAGVAAVVSAAPSLADRRVEIGLAVVALLVVVNLRGTRESGTVFAVPTYLYLVTLASLLALGLWRTSTGELVAAPVDPVALEAVTGGSTVGLAGLAGALIVARAFSSGAIALTGVEAITNGVPAFREPAARNAARTLTTMALLLGAATVAIAVLADRLRPLVSEDETALSQLGAAVFGPGSLGYLLLQAATMGILFLAANTAFAAFPRLASRVAGDGYLPRQLAHLGDRLVFSNGIVLLGAAAAVLLIAFDGSTSALIPLYAVGVFAGFTLSQLGMVRHHRRLRHDGWRRGAVVSGVGATATAAVLVVVVVSKFTAGAWLPVVVVPVIVLAFRVVHRHYARLRTALRVTPADLAPAVVGPVVVLVSRVHRAAVDAIAYARATTNGPLHVATVVTSDEEERKVRRQWEALGLDLPLDVLASPDRHLLGPIDRYLDGLSDPACRARVTVIVPEFVVRHAWERALHTQTAWLVRAHLRHRPGTVVISLPMAIPDTVPVVSPAGITARAVGRARARLGRARTPERGPR